jgi:hypothetical protein
MPSPYLKKLAKETGKSMGELETLWSKAKSITTDTFGVGEGSFGQREYAYATAVVKKMLGLDEELFNPALFLKSEKDAKDYIETLISGTFDDIGNVVPPEPSQQDDEEEDEYDIIEAREVKPADSDVPYDGPGGKGSTEDDQKDVIEDYDDFEEYEEAIKELDKALEDAL